MKITDIRIDESVLPKKDKDWKFALAANPATEGWIERAHPSMEVAAPLIAAALMVGSVFAALRHAEAISARVGEPLGTLALTISVTIIEVAIMASMIAHGAEDPTEAREAVFSAIMIVCKPPWLVPVTTRSIPFQSSRLVR